MEAIEATVCRKGSIRQDSAYSGSIIAYGGFAWLPRQRKQIRQVTWQRRTWMLERGGLNQATQNMEAVTWRLEAGSRNLEPGSWYLPNPSHPKGSEAGVQGACPLPVNNRVRKRGAKPPGPPASERSVRGVFLPSYLLGNCPMKLVVPWSKGNKVPYYIAAPIFGNRHLFLVIGTYFW